MIYLLSQDWINTANNHAGIKYLCNQLAERYPDCYKSIVFPDYSLGRKSGCIIRNIIHSYNSKRLHKKEELHVLKYLKEVVQDGDTLFVLEYLDKEYEMFSFVQRVKKLFPRIRLFCMAHLVPAKLNRLFPNNSELHRWLEPVDVLFTLGSSLKDYLVKRNVEETKVVTTFHYVDDYYRKENTIISNKPPLVIAMGNQVRNIKLLKKVVECNPNVNFVICQGMTDMSRIFVDNMNVRLIPFVSEKELYELMDNADISLNIMDDTIGSNVIVTSMAMGLAMICSDVGSIRDYCDESNTIFCDNDNPDSFSDAIKALQDIDSLIKMKQASVTKSMKYTIDYFHDFIISI